jgi:PleD family two-component response regulator
MHRPYSWGRLAGVGVSCGIVERGTDEDPESLVHRADREMYRQKAGRRRR